MPSDYEKYRERYDYNPETGVITHKRLGRITFKSISGRGYCTGNAFGTSKYAHRVAWLLATGSWPEDDIDHINGDITDNRLANLRVVTHAENMKNQKLFSNNMSGVSGVYWNNQMKKWHARIGAGTRTKTRIHLGHFDNLEAALAARQSAEIERGFHSNHGRR